MNQLISAEFHGTPLSIIDHAGKKWLTAEEVGRCLGYNDANVRKGVNKIYNAHADEFTDSDTCVADLATQGQSREMRIFSDTGCIKLGFFANTPRAKEFRTWASKVLAARQEAAPIPAPAPLDPTMATLATNMAELAVGMKTILRQMNVTGRYIGLLELNQKDRQRVTPAIRRQCLALKGEGMTNADIGRLLRISRTAVSLIVNGKYPETKIEDDQPSIAARMDALIEQEHARVIEQLDGEGGAQ